MVREPQAPETGDEDDEGSPLATILAGIGCLVFSGYLFYYYSQFESAQAGARRMWWILASLYVAVGKWPPVALVALIGVMSIGLGVRALRTPETD